MMGCQGVPLWDGRIRWKLCFWLYLVMCLVACLGGAVAFQSSNGTIIHQYTDGTDDGVFQMVVQGSPQKALHGSWYGVVESVMYKVLVHAFTPRFARVGCCRVGTKDFMCEHVRSRVYVIRGDGSVEGQHSGWKHEAWCGLSYYVELYQILADRGRQALHHATKAHIRIPWCHVPLPVYTPEDTVLDIVPRGGTRGDWATLLLQIENKTEARSVDLEGIIEDVISGNENAHGGICVVQEVQQISVARCVIFMVGFVLVMFAHIISASTACRLAGGSLTFVAMSAVFLAYIVWRQIPHRKSLVAMLTLWGGAAIFIARYLLVGSDDGEPALLPSLLRSPLCIAYLAVSGLVGMAVTYYFNDSHNEKLNTILKVGLQIIGVVCMMMSPTSLEAGAVLTVVTCASIYMYQWKHQNHTKHSPKKNVPYDLDIPNDNGWNNDVGSTPADGENTPSTPTVFRASTVAVPPSPKDFPDTSQLHSLVRRGKILNMETDRTIAIGKGTYNALFLRGYEVDFEKGTMTPPSTKGKEKKHM